jgi:hypothetical protein
LPEEGLVNHHEGQLELFDVGASNVESPNGHELDLRDQIAELVREPDMSEAEVDALIEDVLEQAGWGVDALSAPSRAEPCRCDRSVVTRNPWGRTCLWCGRRPT